MVLNYNSVTLCLFVVYIVYMCIGSVSSCYPLRVPLLLNELTSVLYTNTIFRHVYTLYHVLPLFCKVAVLKIKEIVVGHAYALILYFIKKFYE